jgi:hypothetical protein
MKSILIVGAAIVGRPRCGARPTGTTAQPISTRQDCGARATGPEDHGAKGRGPAQIGIRGGSPEGLLPYADQPIQWPNSSSAASADPRGPAAEVADAAVGTAVSRRRQT